ncbi:MAG TPA: hypothetical protein VIJ35_13330 [Bradyrhizobium sp.]
MFGNNGMNRVGEKWNVFTAFLRGCRQAARHNQGDCRDYPQSLGAKEGHQNSAAGLVKTGRGCHSRQCYMGSDAVGQNASA